jgi:hypothetical protein
MSVSSFAGKSIIRNLSLYKYSNGVAKALAKKESDFFSSSIMDVIELPTY